MMTPCSRCRSLPHTVEPVTLRMTSRGSRILGLGVSTGKLKKGGKDTDCQPVGKMKAKATGQQEVKQKMKKNEKKKKTHRSQPCACPSRPTPSWSLPTG